MYWLVVIMPLHSSSPNKTVRHILSCFILNKPILRGAEEPFLLLFYALKFYQNESKLFLGGKKS